MQEQRLPVLDGSGAADQQQKPTSWLSAQKHGCHMVAASHSTGARAESKPNHLRDSDLVLTSLAVPPGWLSDGGHVGTPIPVVVHFRGVDSTGAVMKLHASTTKAKQKIRIANRRSSGCCAAHISPWNRTEHLLIRGFEHFQTCEK